MYGQNTYCFSINIGPDELMNLYKGSVRRVRVITFEGLVLDLDANHFKQFTTHSGIKGSFRLVTNSENKFLRIERIS